MRSAAESLITTLSDAGHTAYFAGGCVRDLLLGKTPKDYDIATSATPTQVTKLFRGAKTVGAHFGVVLVKRDKEPFEIATFRNDGSYSDGRRPDSVTFSSPEEDAQRRDFTVNGLFLDPAAPEDVQIIDFVGGKADLEARQLRAIGNPADRFSEDHLRLLRAVRFAALLEFEIEPTTWEALCEHAPEINKIAPERIAGELNRMLTAPAAARVRAFDLLAQSGLFAAFLPEVEALRGCEQPPQWHPEGDVFTHTRIMLGMLEDDAPLPLVLSVLFHDIGKPPTQTTDAEDGRIRFNGHDKVGADMAREILGRFRYPNATIDAVAHNVSRHMQFMNVQDMREAKLKRFMAAPDFDHELELHRVDCASSNGFTDNYDFLTGKLEEYANAPIVPPPLVTGRDLIGMGYKPGPTFKEILEETQTRQLEGTLSERETALSWIRAEWPL